LYEKKIHKIRANIGYTLLSLVPKSYKIYGQTITIVLSISLKPVHLNSHHKPLNQLEQNLTVR